VTNCKYAVSNIAKQCTEISRHFIAEETEIRREKNSDVAISPEIAEKSVKTRHSDIVPFPKN